MNSTVRFTIAEEGEFRLTLVYPKDVGGEYERISVLAPVGRALLGLAVGETMEWPLPASQAKRLRVVEVVYQPEQAGDFHL
jgi:regulator of nucleoside diphosphate kinase